MSGFLFFYFFYFLLLIVFSYSSGYLPSQLTFSFTTFAGLPAKVVKENIGWDRRRVEEYIADMNKKNEDEAKKTAAK